MRFVSLSITLLAVLIGWVIFRSENVATASTILLGMAGLVDGNTGQELFELSKAVLGVTLLVSIALFLPNTQQFVGYFGANKSKEVKSMDEGMMVGAWKLTLIWSIFTGMLLSMSILFLARESEFLYFQF